MELTYLGHSCFLLVSGELRLVIDPFITPNPKAAHVEISALNPTHVLVTHGHEDHVADVEVLVKASGAVLVAPYEVATWFGAKGIDGAMAVNPGARIPLNAGPDQASVRVVGAVHSSTLPDGSPGGVACGYVVDFEGMRVYHAGDTDLSMEMELVGRMWSPDLAILPIGGTFTMGYSDVPAAMDMLQCREVVGMHYDTFPPITIDREEACRTVERAEGKLHLLAIGTVLETQH